MTTKEPFQLTQNWSLLWSRRPCDARVEKSDATVFILTHLLVALGFILFSFNAPCLAEETPPVESDGPSLETVLKNVLESNGQIKEAAADIEIANSQVKQADAAAWPRGYAQVLGAPMFGQHGTPLESNSDLSQWGPFFKGYIEIAQPIYTFGQIGSYQKAASSQLTARTEQTEMRRLEMLSKAKELYYSYQMASDFEGLVKDITSYLEEAVETAEQSMKPGKKSMVKPHDLYHLKTALEDIRQKGLYATQGRQTAEKAVQWISAMKFSGLPKSQLVPEDYEKKNMDEYLKLARAKRPEFRALKAGQEARSALRDAKQAQSYPAIFVGAFGSAGWSPVTDKQYSVFAVDPFNSITGGIGVGLRLDLEFKRHEAEASEQEAELMKLKATESYAVPGIELEVKKAFWELEQAADGLEVASRRKKIARKWFVSSAMGWSIGVTPAKDLLEALQGDGEAKQNYIQTVFLLNMALAHLSQAVGQEITSLKYRN
jgi:outer membrane protein TolC